MKDFGYYRYCFMELHTAKAKKLPAPHKPLLLLAVMDLIERGLITGNRVELTDELIRSFKANANRFIGHSIVFRPNIGQPFYHMQHEPFWTLLPKVATAQGSMAAEGAGTYGQEKAVYSIKGLREKYRWAVIDRELFELLQNADARAKLRSTLISKYLLQQPNTMTTMVIAGMVVVSLLA